MSLLSVHARKRHGPPWCDDHPTLYYRTFCHVKPCTDAFLPETYMTEGDLCDPMTVCDVNKLFANATRYVATYIVPNALLSSTVERRGNIIMVDRLLVNDWAELCALEKPKEKRLLFGNIYDRALNAVDNCNRAQELQARSNRDIKSGYMLLIFASTPIVLFGLIICCGPNPKPKKK